MSSQNNNSNNTKKETKRKTSNNSNTAPKLSINNITKEELVEIQSEAYYRALKKIESEKVSVNTDSADTINTASRPVHHFGKEIAVFIAFLFLPLVDLLIHGLKKLGLMKSETGKEILRIFDAPPQLEEYAVKATTAALFYVISIVLYIYFGSSSVLLVSKVAIAIKTGGLNSIICYSKFYNGIAFLGKNLVLFTSGLIFNLIAKSILKQQDIDKVYAFLGVILAIVALNL